MRAAGGLRQGEPGCRHPPKPPSQRRARQGGILHAAGAEIGRSQSIPALGAARLRVGTRAESRAGPAALRVPGPEVAPHPPCEKQPHRGLWQQRSCPFPARRDSSLPRGTFPSGGKGSGLNPCYEPGRPGAAAAAPTPGGRTHGCGSAARPGPGLSGARRGLAPCRRCGQTRLPAAALLGRPCAPGPGCEVAVRSHGPAGTPWAGRRPRTVLEVGPRSVPRFSPCCRHLPTPCPRPSSAVSRSSASRLSLLAPFPGPDGAGGARGAREELGPARTAARQAGWELPAAPGSGAALREPFLQPPAALGSGPGCSSSRRGVRASAAVGALLPHGPHAPRSHRQR